MNNKKYVLSIILFFVSLAAHSQFYIDVYYGYNHSNEKTDVPFENYHYIKYYNKPIDTIYHFDGDDTVMMYGYYDYTLRDNIYCNYYANSLKGISIGYFINKYIGFDISLNNLVINKKKTNINSKYYYELVDTLGYIDYRYYIFDDLTFNNYNLDFSISGNLPLNKFNIFGYLGTNLYYTIIHHDYEEGYWLIPHVKINWEKKYYGYNYGIKTGLGLSYNFYKNLSVFGKFGYSWGELNIDKGELIEYKKGGNETDRDLPAEVKPDNIPFDKIPYSGYNVRIGLRYTFGDPNN
jgi:hypothetical protein